MSSVLFVSSKSQKTTYSNAVLFECAKFFAKQGKKVLLISPKPLNALPPSINHEASQPDPHIFELIHLIYVEDFKEFAKFISQNQGYTVRYQAPIWIITELDFYLNQSTDANYSYKLINSLINAVQVSGIRSHGKGVLLAHFFCPESQFAFEVRKFFDVSWDFLQEEDQLVLKNASPSTGKPCEFHFLHSNENESNLIVLEKIFNFVG